MLGAEHAEILLRVVPNDQEVKAYTEYENSRKPIDVLAEEDKFMLAVQQCNLLTPS